MFAYRLRSNCALTSTVHFVRFVLTTVPCTTLAAEWPCTDAIDVRNLLGGPPAAAMSVVVRGDGGQVFVPGELRLA